ncbi:MAG: lipase [Gammaproteobacteria bacterium]|nr:MAG: lipase [Gammaproteobacteria bacterium]
MSRVTRELSCLLVKSILVFSFTLTSLTLPAFANPSASDHEAKTRYPIVLVHGMLGFRKMFGVIEYFSGVKKKLESQGATVYVTHASAINSNEVRGNQIIQQLEEIRKQTGQADLKFNLIGHSQGGVDIRYVAGIRPDLVASLTSIGSPHKGVNVDSWRLLNSQRIQNAPNFITGPINLALRLNYLLLTGTWKPMDIKGALLLLDMEQVQAFNQRFPGGIDDQYCETGAPVTETEFGEIKNYSWTGSEAFTNGFDVADSGLWLISKGIYGDEKSDGLVSVCSAQFGMAIETGVKMNHLDEMNIFITAWGEQKKPLQVYEEHASRLRFAGL